MAKQSIVDMWWKNEFNSSDLIFFYFKLQAGADAAVDVGVICTEGSMWSELSMIVPTHTFVKVE